MKSFKGLTFIKLPVKNLNYLLWFIRNSQNCKTFLLLFSIFGAVNSVTPEKACKYSQSKLGKELDLSVNVMGCWLSLCSVWFHPLIFLVNKTKKKIKTHLKNFFR